MKGLVAALLFVPAVFAAEPDFSHLKVEPLPFPQVLPDAAPMSLGAIAGVADSLDPIVGGYPPKFEKPEERPATYEKWSGAIRALELVAPAENERESVLVLQARLYRQGHNMDVRECGERAGRVIEAGLKKYPDSIPMNFQASYFYLQVDPKYAPEGEKALMRLRRLLGTDKNPEVERGLVFAYLFQNKIKEAKKQIDRCLRTAPDDKMLLQFREALKSGKVTRISH